MRGWRVRACTKTFSESHVIHVALRPHAMPDVVAETHTDTHRHTQTHTDTNVAVSSRSLSLTLTVPSPSPFPWVSLSPSPSPGPLFCFLHPRWRANKRRKKDIAFVLFNQFFSGFELTQMCGKVARPAELHYSANL